MKLDKVEIAELTEDFKEAFNSENFVANISEVLDTLYVGLLTSSFRYLISKEAEDVFLVQVTLDGVIDENPLLDFSNKRFSRKQMIAFVVNFETNILKPNDFNICLLKKKNLSLLGINFNMFFSMDESYDTYHKNCILEYVLYCKESKTNRVYRVLAFDSYGMCASGYTSASWGETSCSLLDINDIPKDFCYVPKQFTKISIEVFDYGVTNISILQMGKKHVDVLSVEFDGGDDYYPNGGVNDKLALVEKETLESPWKEYFYKNFSLYKEMLSTEQVVLLSEEEENW